MRTHSGDTELDCRTLTCPDKLAREGSGPWQGVSYAAMNAIYICRMTVMRTGAARKREAGTYSLDVNNGERKTKHQTGGGEKNVM